MRQHRRATHSAAGHAVLGFGVLGPLEVLADDEKLALGGPRQRAVLAILLASANRPVSVDELIEQSWSGQGAQQDGDGAVHILHTYISALRRLLGQDRIERTGAHTYVIHLRADELDATRFADAVRRGCAMVATNPSEAEGVLSDALRLWRGRPYGDVGDEIAALTNEVTRLEELRLAAIEQRNEAILRRGRDPTLIADLRAAIAESPYRERSRAQLMVALYRDGRQTEALAEYRHFRSMLVSELGLDPSPELQRLERRILLQDPTLNTIDADPPHNLASPITKFVGRHRELDELEALLADERLLTLTGVAGVGKSRLALELAHRMRPRFADGAWWVDLAAVTDPDRVTYAVTNALGVGESSDAKTQRRLLNFVRARSLLLILDNCEHVAAACAEVVELLLASAPSMKVLATSRVPLHLTGENRRRVPPLDLPEPGQEGSPAAAQSEAFRLFVDRARSAESSFALGAANQRAVAAICRQLDGIPLALELAAARTSVLSPDEILTGLADRFAMLTDENQPARATDATLRQALDWSYDQLSADEQASFRALGVFVGGFTLEAATAVACEPDASPSRQARLLGRLVETSMVEPRAGDGGASRFRLLETLRAYALDRLKEAGGGEAVAARHSDYFRRLASSAEARLGGAARRAALSRVEKDMGNVEAALEWSLAHEGPARAILFIRAAAEAWHNRGQLSTAQLWADRLVASDLTEVAADVRGRAFMAAGLTALYQGDYPRAAEQLEAAIALFREADDMPRLAEALGRRGQLAAIVGDLPRMACVAESLALFETLGDRLGCAWPMEAACLAAVMSGDWRPEVARQLETAGALFEELQDITGQSLVLCLRSVLAGRIGNPAAALDYAERMLTLTSPEEERLTHPLALTTLALATLARDLDARDVRRGEALARQAITVASDIGSMHDVSLALAPLAWAALDLGRPERAARLLGAAERHSLMVRTPLVHSIMEPLVGDGIARLGASGFDAERQAGCDMSLDEAVKFGLRTDQ